jgi:hypothetical protein
MRIVFPKVLIELRPSQVDGIGVFAIALLGEDQRIAEGIHESDYARLIAWEHYVKYDPDVRAKIDAFCIGTADGFIPPARLDFNRLSVEWYLNHSCDGNVGFNEVGDFVARRGIEKGEELTYDYALAESKPRFRMECKCGSASCRGVVTGNDWKDPEFREKNLDYMLPRLRRVSGARRFAGAKAVRAVERRR